MQPGRPQSRVALQDVGDEGLVRIEPRRRDAPHHRPDELLAVERPHDRRVVDAELGGDRPDPPVLGVEEPPNARDHLGHDHRAALRQSIRRKSEKSPKTDAWARLARRHGGRRRRDGVGRDSIRRHRASGWRRKRPATQPRHAARPIVHSECLGEPQTAEVPRTCGAALSRGIPVVGPDAVVMTQEQSPCERGDSSDPT